MLRSLVEARKNGTNGTRLAVAAAASMPRRLVHTTGDASVDAMLGTANGDCPTLKLEQWRMLSLQRTTKLQSSIDDRLMEHCQLLRPVWCIGTPMTRESGRENVTGLVTRPDADESYTSSCSKLSHSSFLQQKTPRIPHAIELFPLLVVPFSLKNRIADGYLIISPFFRYIESDGLVVLARPSIRIPRNHRPYGCHVAVPSMRKMISLRARCDL
jgi:hypothetical protein